MFLGTYHGNPRPGGSVRGTFQLKSSSNQIWTGKFDDWKPVKHIGGTLVSDDLGEKMIQSLRASWGLSDTDMVHCYKKVSVTPLTRNPNVFDAAILLPDERADKGYTSKMNTWYRASATNATPGKFEMFITGVDDNLSPCTKVKGSPCTMTKTNRFAFPISVCTNGKGCGAYPYEANKTAMGGTVPDMCKTNVSSGFLCPVTCPKKSVGQVLCDDGVWFDDHKCVDSFCSLPTNVDFPGIGGIEGFGCGFTTGPDTVCEVIVEKEHYLATPGATLTCQPNGTWTPSPGLEIKQCPGKGTSAECFPTTTTTTVSYTGPCTTVTVTTGPCGESVAAKFGDQHLVTDDADPRSSQTENSILSKSGMFVVGAGVSIVALLAVVGMFARRFHCEEGNGFHFAKRNEANRSYTGVMARQPRSDQSDTERAEHLPMELSHEPLE